jgi:predicted anti-sigma-YlaC factor YlaD
MWIGLRSRQCERARELASLRLDGELSELEEALLRTHQSRCGACHAFSRSLTAFTGELRNAPLQPPRRPFALPRRPRVTTRPMRFAAAAAAAIAVVAGAGTMVAELGSPAGETPPVGVGAAGKTDLLKLRQLRRNELVVASAVNGSAAGVVQNPALETVRGPRAHGGI